MTDLTTEAIEEILARAEAATPEPWTHKNIAGAGHEIHAPVGLSTGVQLPFSAGDKPVMIYGLTGPQICTIAAERWVQFDPEGWDEMQEQNGEFVAHARTDLPRLCRALLAERKEREAERAELERLRTDAKRLDWLEQRARVHSFHLKSIAGLQTRFRAEGLGCLGTHTVWGDGDSARSATDAAMKEQP